MKYKEMEQEFKRCCIQEVKRIWNGSAGPMSIIRFEGHCPVCGHYIGLTQTSIEEAEKILRKHHLIFSDN